MSAASGGHGLACCGHGHGHGHGDGESERCERAEKRREMAGAWRCMDGGGLIRLSIDGN